MKNNDILTTVNTRKTPQSEKASPKQKKNHAGGFSFEVSLAERVKRFLILGSSDNTFYASAQEVTKESAEAVFKMAESNHKGLLDLILDVSLRGAAPKQEPTLFALAIAASVEDADARKAALEILPQVARISTHLFTFTQYVKQFRGWGRALRSAVGNWYTGKEADALAYQMVKYRNRKGYTHRDVLRLSHPATTSPQHRALFKWTTSSEVSEDLPRIVEGYLKAQEAGANVPSLVREYRLTWEMLPDAARNDPATWEALLDVGIPQTALIRNLPTLTRLGLLPALGGRTKEVVAQITDQERLVKSRVHPLVVLNALGVYASGRSFRGDSTWSPSAKITDALNDAFYAAFGAVEPANKRTMIALDISGSMSWSNIAGMNLTPRTASAALALVTQATEPDSAVYAFSSGNYTSNWGRRGSDGITEMNISSKMRLDDVLKKVDSMGFGGTDCALPMLHATKNKLEVDTFVIYTDSETWAGDIHPHQALKQYRDTMGIPAKLVVVGMQSSGFTIADPNDSGSLDVVGFDTATPNLISNFSKGL